MEQLAHWVEEHASNLVQQVDRLTFNVHVQRGKALVVAWLDPDAPDLQVRRVGSCLLRSGALNFLLSESEL